MNAQYVDAFLTGSVRVGTLAEFRVQDGIEGGRNDVSEGVTNWKPGAVTVAVDNQHPFAQGSLSVPEGKEVYFKFGEGTVLSVQGNCYLFCASSALSDNLIKRMSTDFGADACVKIRNPQAFARELSSHPLLSGYEGRYSPVTTRINNFVRDYQGNDPFKKNWQYGWQREVRFIWQGKSTPATGEVILVPGIARLLKRVV